MKRFKKIYNRITAWSYSRWACYTKCPFMAKCKFIDRLKEPTNEAMSRGSAIHKKAENWVNGMFNNMPEELNNYRREFRALLKESPVCEEQWAFTKDWHPTGWFDKDCWVRVMVDVHAGNSESSIRIIDHKTGKPNDSHREQLSLYALAAFSMFPDVTEATTELWYLDHPADKRLVHTFSRDEVDELKKMWEGRVKPMLNDTTFKPKPNFGCRWCFFRKDNGGPCQY